MSWHVEHGPAAESRSHPNGIALASTLILELHSRDGTEGARWGEKGCSNACLVCLAFVGSNYVVFQVDRNKGSGR